MVVAVKSACFMCCFFSDVVSSSNRMINEHFVGTDMKGNGESMCSVSGCWKFVQ